MPTRNVNLTDELDRFVAKKVRGGRYENTSEVVCGGLRTLEREEQQYEAKMAALRAAKATPAVSPRATYLGVSVKPLSFLFCRASRGRVSFLASC